MSVKSRGSVYQLHDEEKRQSPLVTSGKAVILIFSIVVITIDVLSGFHTITFFAANLISVVISCITFVAPLFIISSFRKFDLIAHCACAAIMFVSACIYMAEYFRLRGQFRQLHNSSLQSSLAPQNGYLAVNHAMAISAFSLGIVQAILHALLGFVVFIRK